MAVKGRKVTVDYLAALGREVRRSAESPGVDEVHDLRVAVRRAAEALRLFKEKLPAGLASKLRRRIRKIRDCAAAVRDRDVTGALLEEHGLSDLDPALVYLKGERAMAAKHLQAQLYRLVEKKKVDAWISTVKTGGEAGSK